MCGVFLTADWCISVLSPHMLLLLPYSLINETISHSTNQLMTSCLSLSVCFLLSGCGERTGGQHSTEAAARQRSGTRSDPERRQTHRHPGAGARPGDDQPPMELTQQTGTAQYPLYETCNSRVAPASRSFKLSVLLQSSESTDLKCSVSQHQSSLLIIVLK